MLLEAKDIHKSYNEGNKAVSVLRGINLNIDRGDFIAVTGPSGAGKSTLLHILGGLDTPSHGTVLFEGEDISRIGDSRLCRIRGSRRLWQSP